MKDSLATLGRIKKFELDEQQRILGEELGKEQKLLKSLNKLNQDYEKEKEFVAQNGMIGNFGLYTDQYLKKRKETEEKIKSVQQKIAEIRAVMADIFKERKTYEIIDKNRKDALKKELDAKEQKMLDEIGTNSYIKKHKN